MCFMEHIKGIISVLVLIEIWNFPRFYTCHEKEFEDSELRHYLLQNLQHLKETI